MADESELHEALEALLKAETELKKQKRALFPAVLARRRATSRVLDVWKAMKGQPSDPSRPILDAIDASARAPDPRPASRARPERQGKVETDACVEETPDGSPSRPVHTIVAAPPQGWWPSTLRHGAEMILGSKPGAEGLADLVICAREWCRALRYAPHSQPTGRCPQCKDKKCRSYLAVLDELEAQQSSEGLAVRELLAEALGVSDTDRFSWDVLRRQGASDEDIRENLRFIWGDAHRITKRPRYTTRGMPTPAFWTGSGIRPSQDIPTLAGQQLIEEIRSLLGIATPQVPRSGIDLVTSRPRSTPTTNGQPELEPEVMKKSPKEARRKKEPALPPAATAAARRSRKAKRKEVSVG